MPLSVTRGARRSCASAASGEGHGQGATTTRGNVTALHANLLRLGEEISSYLPSTTWGVYCAHLRPGRACDEDHGRARRAACNRGDRREPRLTREEGAQWGSPDDGVRGLVALVGPPRRTPTSRVSAGSRSAALAPDGGRGKAPVGTHLPPRSGWSGQPDCCVFLAAWLERRDARAGEVTVGLSPPDGGSDGGQTDAPVLRCVSVASRVQLTAACLYVRATTTATPRAPRNTYLACKVKVLDPGTHVVGLAVSPVLES